MYQMLNVKHGGTGFYSGTKKLVGVGNECHRVRRANLTAKVDFDCLVLGALTD